MENEKQEPKKTKKKTSILKILISLVILVAVLVAIILFSIDGIIKVGIEKAVTKQLGVKASVGSVRLKVLSGDIQIYDLKISNPDGYEYANIMELHSANATAKLVSLFSDTIEISQITLDGITLAIEQKGLGSNLNDILKSIPKSDSKPAPATDKKAKNVYIASLDMNEIKVNAKLLPIPGKLDATSITLTNIHLSDIGKDNKATLAQVVGEIFTAIAEAVAKEGTDILPKILTSSVSNILDSGFETATKAGGEILKKADGAGKEVQKITEGLKGILNKK